MFHDNSQGYNVSIRADGQAGCEASCVGVFVVSSLSPRRPTEAEFRICCDQKYQGAVFAIPVPNVVVA